MQNPLPKKLLENPTSLIQWQFNSETKSQQKQKQSPNSPIPLGDQMGQINIKKMQKEERQQNISASTAVKHSSRSSSSHLLDSENDQQVHPQSGTAIFTNPETSAINSRLNNVLTSIQGLLEDGEISEAIVRLHQLSEKMHFMKNNGKMFDDKFQIVCYYNLGCAYQTLVFVKSNQEDLNDCITNINLAIKTTTQIIRNQEKNNKQQNHQNFKMKIFHAKMLLQCCALLSQVDNHEMALQYGREALSMLTHIFKKAKAVAKGQLKKIKEMKEKKVKNSGGNSQAMVFAENLLNVTLKELEELQTIENFEGVMSISTTNFQKIKQNSYFWRNNFQNNCKTFKKQMNKISQPIPSSSSSSSLTPSSSTKPPKNSPLKKGSSVYYSCQPLHSKQSSSTSSIRNCLGMKISNSWISELNIGKVMRMAPMSYVYFIQPGNVGVQFSARNLIQKVILVCAIYFSLATEMRFLQDSQTDPKKKPSQNPPTKKSQLFHFKAIELAYKYIKQDCPLVDHLITSYLKHYHSSLASIQQKPSFVQHSQIFGQVKKSTLILNSREFENGVMGIGGMDGLDGKGDYMILDCHGGEEIQGVFSSRQTMGYQKSTKINLLDSGEMDRGERGGLTKSVQWSKKISSKQFHQNKSNITNELTSSTKLKLLKKSSSTSTMAKDSITIKQPKSPDTSHTQKSKLKRTKSSNKNIIKVLKVHR